MGKHTIIIFMSLLVLSTEALAQETKDKQVSDSVDLQEVLVSEKLITGSQDATSWMPCD